MIKHDPASLEWLSEHPNSSLEAHLPVFKAEWEEFPGTNTASKQSAPQRRSWIEYHMRETARMGQEINNLCIDFQRNYYADLSENEKTFVLGFLTMEDVDAWRCQGKKCQICKGQSRIA